MKRILIIRNFLIYLKLLNNKRIDMATLIINTNDQSELRLLEELLKKMKISAKVLTNEDKENLGLLKLLNEVDRTKKVSKSKVIKKLSGK